MTRKIFKLPETLEFMGYTLSMDNPPSHIYKVIKNGGSIGKIDVSIGRINDVSISVLSYSETLPVHLFKRMLQGAL